MPRPSNATRLLGRFVGGNATVTPEFRLVSAVAEMIPTIINTMIISRSVNPPTRISLRARGADMTSRIVRRPNKRAGALRRPAPASSRESVSRGADQQPLVVEGLTVAGFALV